MPATRDASLRRRALLAAALLAASWLPACAGAPETAAGGGPVFVTSPDVTLEVEWRTELVDPGLWTYEPTELGRVALSADGRRAYAGTSDGVLFAVSTTDGEVLWSTDLGEPLDGLPAVWGEELYVPCSDGFLYALDGGGGIRWRYDAGGSLDSGPAVSEREVIFATGAGVIVSLNRGDGTLRWRAEDDDPVLRATRGLHPGVKGQNSPRIVGDIVYAGFPSGRFLALDLPDGDILWAADLGGGADRHTDVDEPAVPFAGRVAASSFAGGLYALDGESGSVAWRADLRGASRPVPYRDQLLTTTVDGSFVSLSQADGSQRFRVRLDDRAPGRIALIGDYALVPTTQGALYVLDAASPFIYSRFTPADGFASVATGDDGLVVALDNRGVLHGLTLRAR